MTTSSDGTPLNVSDCFRLALRVCSLMTAGSGPSSGAASCSASLNRLNCPEISLDFHLKSQRVFRKIINLFLEVRNRFIASPYGVLKGFDQLILAVYNSIQLADCILHLHDPGVFRVFCHFFALPSQMPLFYHKKRLAGSGKPAV